MLPVLIPHYHDELERIRAVATSGFVLAFHLHWSGPEYLRSEFPAEWRRIYEEHNYFLSDPVLRWNISGEGYKRWSEISGPDPLRVMRNAQKFGLVFGAAFTRTAGKKRSLMSVARADRELTDAELEVLNARFVTFVDLVGGRPLLTDAELEVLHYLRDGYEQQEIAALVGVSKSAIKQRVQKACQKLQARNSAQAIAICVAQHYFDESVRRPN